MSAPIWELMNYGRVSHAVKSFWPSPHVKKKQKKKTKKQKNSTVILASHVPTPFTESNLQIARTDIIGTVQSIDAYGPAN